MATRASPERSILVFAIWAVLGFLGLGFVLDGMAHESVAAAVAGVTLLLATFAAHIVVNAVFGVGFSHGETALGIGLYGLLALVFVVARIAGRLGEVGYLTGIAVFGLLAAGFIAYLAARHGLRGAFSYFHSHAEGAAGRRSGR